MVGPWRPVLLRKNSFSLIFSVSIYSVSKLWFSFFTSFDLGEDQDFLPNSKMIYKRNAASHRGLLGQYPFVAGVSYVLRSLMCWLCCCLHPNLVDSGECGTWHHSSPCPACPGCKGNSWCRGQVSLSAGNLWVLPSSPHLLPKKSPSQVAVDCNLLPARTAGNGLEQRRFQPTSPQESILQGHFSCR